MRWLIRTVIVLVVAGCGGGGGATGPRQPVPTSITISPNPITLSYLNEQSKVTVRVLDQDGKVMSASVTFTTSDENVASVTSSGTVTAVANGTATITAAVGNISASTNVTVSQKATRIVLVSGSGQEAIADSTLPEPVVVGVQDFGGAGVAGVAVTFTPDTGNGSVSVSSSVSDADGKAETEWTLGSSYGPQRLVAAIEAGQVAISATARSATPTADIAVIQNLVADRPDPSSLETFVARTRIRNNGDLATGTFAVRLLVNGTELETRNLASLAPGDSATVEFTLGPLAAGSYALRFVADPDNAIQELDETNNETSLTVNVVEQTELTTSSSTPVSANTNGQLLFRVDVPAGTGKVLDIETTGGTGDADLFVQAGDRPSTKNGYKSCLSYGPTTQERCQFATPDGPYQIIVFGSAAFTGTTLSVSLVDSIAPFNITLEFLTTNTAAEDSAFTRAARRWERIIVGDLMDYNLAGSGQTVDANCVASQPEFPNVDDLLIYVSIDSIDGPGGTLGQSGPCYLRAVPDYSYVGLPFLGAMHFDEADIANLLASGDLDAVILHEMGHVLGFGALCEWQVDGAAGCDNVVGLLVDPSLPDNKGADTHFTGSHAIEAFDEVGGASYTGAKVPVENEAGAGSADAHWRESVFHTELMTPYLDSGQPNPLSIVSLMQFVDLGYQVDPSQADVYTLPMPFPGPVRIAGERKMIDLSGDVRRGPIEVMDPKGRIVRVLYR